MSHCLASLVWFLSLWTLSSSVCPSDTRVRRPWHTLTDEEQMLYVLGFQELARESVLIQFVEAHEKATAATINIHTSSQNFFWHSYWLYELESSFRELGAEYECFTLPYWDVTHDEKFWHQTHDIADLPIYHSNLGGNGNLDDNYCVGAPWSTEFYVTDSLCAEDEEPMKCCLKRFHVDNDDSMLYSMADFTELLVAPMYASFSNFSERMFHIHGHTHDFVATHNYTHFNRFHGQPSSDPLFPLFHSFIEQIRLLRQDCYQFDLVAADDLEQFMPFSYEVENCTLDYHMDFSILCDGSNGEGERMCSDMVITPRMLYDISPNTRFGVLYELGEFWSDNGVLQSECSGKMNATWWSVAGTDGDRVGFVSQHSLQSAEWLDLQWTLLPVGVMLVGVVVIAAIRRCEMSMRRRKLEEMGDGGIYGAI